MENTITGSVLNITPVETFTAKSGKQYTKRTLILDCTPYDRYTGQRSEYENILPFEFVCDTAATALNFNAGDIVEVGFFLDGHSYTDRNGVERRAINVRPRSVKLVRTPAAALAQQIAAQPASPYQPAPAPAAPVQAPAYTPQQPVQAPYPQQPAQQASDNLPF